jgi:hypothetical protein
MLFLALPVLAVALVPVQVVLASSTVRATFSFPWGNTGISISNYSNIAGSIPTPLPGSGPSGRFKLQKFSHPGQVT